MDEFSRTLVRWHKKHGRHDLPWQLERTPYRVWISEIMLQQTQVNTVIPYYNAFMASFTDVQQLAAADIDQVLHHWTGLGYYARARNLHRAAKQIVDEHGGQFPDDIEALMALPGIGRSTAGAILALAFEQSAPILDGNVKRVLTRYHGVHGWPGKREVEKALWELAIRHTPTKQVAIYTQAIMDLGASLCSRGKPDCAACPLNKACVAREQGIQEQLPGRKPRKTLPVKQTRFALIENQHGELLLERRPPAGIWGGLWGFPEVDVDTDLQAAIREARGMQTRILSEYPVIRHTFSHFHLDITPVRLALSGKGTCIEDSEDICWYIPRGTQQLGMAAPVLKLLEKYYSNTSGGTE